jgi:sugar lactone lactonase YvrE
MESVILEQIAQSPWLWTGIAAMPDGRIFVNFPYWFEDVPVSVAELLPGGKVLPFPDAEWNRRSGEPESHFICVQSVVADRDGCLWVLDTGNPLFSGIITGAAKLLKFDVRDGHLLSSTIYSEPVILPDTYLNDVRIDTMRGMAYLTDSGTGAIVVSDLQNGKSRRVLDDHPSVKAEDVDVVFDDVAWRQPDGSIPRIHSDGIALSPDNSTLYFQALTGRTLYRISTACLRNPKLSAVELGNKVEKVGITGPADGLEFSPNGTLYLTSLEDHAVKRLMPDGSAEMVVQDDRLQWPDSLAVTPDGMVYVTTSRIHLGKGPYGLFRFKP